MENILVHIEKYAKEKTAKVVAHDFMHVNRVRNWAIKIANKEGYKDLEMVEAAGLLHDIGRSRKGDHGDNGAIMAQDFLHKNKFFTDKQIDEICNAIKNHNSYNEGKGKLLEILKDADMMDAFGAIGAMRACSSHYYQAPYDEKDVKYYTWGFDKIQMNKVNKYGNFDNIVDLINFQISLYSNLYTASAKQLAKPLRDYLRNFVLELDKEVKGNKKGPTI